MITVFLALTSASASAAWLPPVTVTEGGTQYSFGQDVGPNGSGMVVWSGPSGNDDGYSVFARRLEAAGGPGPKLTLSTPDPGVAFASAYAPTVRYDGAGVATVVWMETTYGSESCFNQEGGSGNQEGEDCEVDEYVLARQVSGSGSLSAVRQVQHRHTVYPDEGSFGGSSPAYVTYGQPALAGGPANTLTVVWSEGAFGSGCTAYGYSSSYADSECEAQADIKWARLDAGAVPLGSPQSAYTSETSGYGSGQPLLSLRVGAAADGTATVLFGVRATAAEEGCWGGESTVGFLRIKPGGTATAPGELDSGCGAVRPDLALDPGGTATAVWGWVGTYSGDEALLARIDPGGAAEQPRSLLDFTEGAHVSGLDVARGGAGAALAVWSEEGRIRSRRIPTSGSLAPTATVATPAPGHDFLAPRLAVGPDDSAAVVWEAGSGSFASAYSLRAVDLAPNGTPGQPRTLLAANRWNHGVRVSPGAAGKFLASWRVSVPRHNRVQAAWFGAGQAPGNDDIQAATSLDPELPDFTAGSTAGATRQPGEPDHADAGGGASVWYSWTPSESGPVTLSTCADEGFDPALAVYTGATLAALTEVAAAGDGAPAPCVEGDSGVRFDAVAGTTYRIAVDGEGDSEGSFALELVSRQSAPVNDDFADARAIAGTLPRLFSADNVDGSREPGEPEHGGEAGGASVWYSWTASNSAPARVSVCGHDLSQPLLGVYTGATLAGLSPVGAQSGPASDCVAGASVRFEAVAGTTYRVAVDGRDGREGRFALRFAQRPANDDLEGAETISSFLPAFASGTNFAATKQPGEPAHAGDPGGASVWYSWTPSTRGEAILSACLFAGKDRSALLAVYSGPDLGHLNEVASDAGGGSTSGCFSRYSEVGFSFEAGKRYLIALDGPGGTEASFSLSLESGPANDDFSAAQEIPSESSWFYGSNRHATKQPGEPAHAGNPGGASVWFTWTPAETGVHAISTCSFSALDPLLAVYTGSAIGGLTPVASDDDSGKCTAGDAEVRFTATAGTTYRIAVDGKSASSGSFELRFVTPPGNDDLAAAIQLSGGTPVVIGGSNWLATKQPGEPAHAGNPGGASVWYSWTPSQSARVQLTVCSFGVLDPLLAVYTGASPAALAPVASEDVGANPECYGHSTSLELDAQAGTAYRIAVDGRNGSYGEFSLALRSTPANDDFAAAATLASGLPQSTFGENRLASSEPGEPAHAGKSGGASVWYSWTPAGNGTVIVSTCSFGTLDPLLAVYTGSSPATLQQVAAGDDVANPDCAARDAKVRFEAHAGTTYRIAVDGKGGSAGQFQLQLRAAGPVNDDFSDAIGIAQAPGIHPGTTAGAGAQPGEPGGSQQSVWYRMQADHNGTVRLHTCSDAGTPMDLDVFTGSSLTALSQVAMKPAASAAACGSAPGTSLFGDTPELGFDAVAGTVYWISVDRYQQISPVFELRPPGPFALVVDAPANDLRAAAERIPLGGADLARTNVGATHEPGEDEHAGDPGGGSIWFRWFARANGPLSIDTCGSGVDTLLSVYATAGAGGSGGSAGEQYSDTPPAPGGGGSAGEQYSGNLPPSPAPGGVLASSDDSELCGAGSTQSGVELQAHEGLQYLIAVDGKEGETGPIQLNLDFDTPDTTPPETHASVPQAINSHVLFVSVTRDEPESSFQCSVDGGAFAQCAPAGPDDFLTIEIPGLADGTHTGALREVDAAGNVDPTPLEGSLLVDTVAPQTSFTGGPEGPTRELGPFQLSADEPTLFFECAIDGAPTSSCASPYFAPSNLADGTHTLKAIAVDRAFNRDPTPATRTFKLDRTAPVGSIDAGPQGTVAADNVAFEFSANEPATFRCRLDGGTLSDCASSVSFAGLRDAEHHFSLVPTDAVGNVGSSVERDFRVEARPPETTIQSGPLSPLASTAAQFHFSGDEELSGFECALDGAAFADCGASYELKDLSEGPHTLAVRAVDLAGKRDPSPAEHHWVIDTTPPQTTIQSGPSGLTREGGPFKFAANESVSRFECSLDQAGFVPCFSGYSIPPVPDGGHTLAVRAVDLAGNVDPTAAETSLTLDTTPPEVEITTPPPPLAQSSVTIEFEVGEAGASTRCQVDNRPRVACASPFGVDGLADGQHTISVIATDQVGNEGIATSEQFTVDEQPPDTFIAGVAPYISERSPSIFFGGSADAAEYRCSLDEQPFAECESPLELEDLAEGEHVVRVYSIDTVGNVDPTPDSVSFVVDAVPPETTITSAPDGPVHDPVVPFSFASSEDLGGFECAMDGGPFGFCGAIVHDGRVGDHVFEVRALDRAGNADPTPASHPFSVINQAPQASLSLDRNQGPAPLDVSATVGGSDADADELKYQVQFGDGASAGGELPHAEVAHTFTQPGVYVVRLEVGDGFERSVVTETVTVGPPEPLAARAGDDRTVVVGEAVSFDGADSRPLRGIGGYQWSFGDGGAGTGSSVTHSYAEPGTYEARLTVSRGDEEEADTARITVLPPAASQATVTVRGDGAPLPGAEVLVMPADGSKIQALSDGVGVVRLNGLADGSYKVVAYKPGFLPAKGDLTIAGGSGHGVVDLHAGEPATATVESHPMTLDEIEAAGIDPNDPDNQHVYQFEVHLSLSEGGSVLVGGMINRDGFLAPGCQLTSTTECRIGFGGGGGGGGIGYLHTTWVDGLDAPLLSALVIPFRATFLKEFYDVSMVVNNLASEGFDLRNGEAAIELPSGMSLAPTAKPQSLGVGVPDIPGGGSARIHWILRGDTEGEYDLAAHYGATLEPFGRSLRLDARTSEPIKVWGGSALQLQVDVDDKVRDRYPYTVFVKLKNVADVPVYNPAVELLKEGSVGYIEQPNQQRAYGVRELLPGQTHVAGPFIIVPEPTGTIDLSHSFIRKTAGDVNLGGTIVTHPRQPSFEGTPSLEPTNQGEQVKLDWEPVPGADHYEVYETPDRKTPFGEEPIHLDKDGETAGFVAAPAEGEQAFYAISTIVDGRHTMVHPLVEAPPPPPPGEEKEDAAGAPKGECGLTRVTIGPAEILASCFVKKENNVYEATSRVRVNGIDLFPQDARVIVDAQQQRILVSRARVQVGNIVLYQGRIDWSPRVRTRLGLAPGTVIRGIPVSGDLAIDLQPNRADLEASAKLPSALGGVSGTLKLGATNADGPKLDLFELKASGLSLAGRLGIDGVEMSYKRTAAGDRWEGGATLSIPRPQSPLRVHGRLAILNGKFSSAAADVDGINQHIAYGVFLQRLRAAVAVDPLSLSGGIGLSAGPQVLSHEAISVDGDGTVTFGNPHVYEVRGKVRVVEAEIASGYLSYRTSGLVEFGGKLGIDKSGFKASVSADGWVDGTRAFNAHGTGTFSVSRASFGAEGVVSSVGIAACRRGSGPDIGAGYRWGGDATFFASSCDIGEFEAVRSSAAGGGLRFQVARGEPVEVLAFSGGDAPPRVILRESDGTRVVTPVDGRGIDEPQLMLAQSERDDTTYVAVFSPPGGTWTVETAPGSAPVTGVRRAGALPAPQAAATVEPEGQEAVLHWQVRPIPGQRIQFVERTAHGAQVIATTNSATGTATFAPLADDDASRQIVAEVEQYGLPRTAIPVERYAAPAAAPAGSSAEVAPVADDGLPPATGPRASRPRRPDAPARVSVRRRGSRVVVSWSAVGGASRYVLRGRLSNGRRVLGTRTGRRFVIGGVPAGDGVFVSVRALGSDGRRGAARPARLRAVR